MADLSEYVEEIRIIRFTCSFCGETEDFERETFSRKIKKDVTGILAAGGWAERTSYSVEGLACPACIDGIDGEVS